MFRRVHGVWFLPVCLMVSTVHADEIFVGPDAEHATINAALSVAQDGDTITVRAGQYEETIETTGPGVTIRAAENANVLVTYPGYVLRIRHERTTVEGLVLDGQYSERDGVQVRGEAHQLTLRNVEVRRIGADCIDMGSQNNVLIEGCRIHHCLRSSRPDCDAPDCREDAHGVTGGSMQNLTIRDTDIHSFSGDAIQLDPGRNEPGWSGLMIDGSRLWLSPLEEAAGGYAAGIVPGENALDTKTSDDALNPAEVMITNTHAWGFRGGLIGNMAAFNLKENVRVTLDRSTVNDSEIAFRLRGATDARPRGAQVTISNSLVFDVGTGIRYEDRIDIVSLRNVTFGGDVERHFRDVSENGRIDGRNVLVLAEALPGPLNGPSNLAVDSACFADAIAHDYHLSGECPAVDAGEALADGALDRDGTARPQGNGWDIGAYEFCDGDCADPQEVEPDAGVPMTSDAMVDATVEPEPEMDAGTPNDVSIQVGTDLSMTTSSMDGGGARPQSPDVGAPSKTNQGGCVFMGPLVIGQTGGMMFLVILLGTIRRQGRRL